MSRSRRKRPITGITPARTEKQEKRLYNRRYRRVCKERVRVDPECEQMPLLREIVNVWSLSKDGKHRFDPTKNPKRMRK